MATNSDMPELQNTASYHQYKKNTSTLVRWVITTADAFGTPEPPKKRSNNPKNKKKAAKAARANAKPSDTEISISEFVSLSATIAEAGQDVPDAIFSLFNSVIAARTAAYKIWTSITAAHPDKEIEKSNERHWHFIEALQSAYDTLGGLKWRERNSEQGDCSRKSKDIRDEKISGKENDEAAPSESETVFRLANRFNALKVEPLLDDDQLQLEEMAIQGTKAMNNDGTHTAKAASKGKGKAKRAVVESLEKYKIKSETETNFAVCCFMKDMINLRMYTSNIWRQVGLGQVHCAVAGALSNVAIGMMKSIQYDLMMDYPECTCYRTITDHFVRNGDHTIVGDNKLQSGSTYDAESTKQIEDIAGADAAAIEESLLLSTHDDLVTFIADYRKNRTGKPSSTYKNTNWNPNFKDTRFTPLKDLTPQNLRKWKADYTISWLYDLVNTYAYERLRDGSPKLKNPEKMDWDCGESGECKWTRRQLWGPVDFAYDITRLAMQTSKAPIEGDLKPHHILQLQIAVDSMLSAKRWAAQDVPPADCYGSPSSASLWDQNDDIQKPEGMKINWMLSTQELMRYYESDRERTGSSTNWSHPLQYLHEYMCDVLLLAESPIALRSTIPGSLFSKSSKNGLWLYSPYLCGTGMIDALRFSYDWGTKVWDRSRCMVPFLHLYHMLRQNGQLKCSIDIVDQLITMFKDDIFQGGQPPKRRYYEAFQLAVEVRAEHLGDPNTRRRGKAGASRTHTTPLFRNKGKINDHNKFVKQSRLFALSQANWLIGSLDQKKFPCIPQSKGNNIEILDSLKAVIEEDIEGPHATTSLNYNLLLTVVCKIFGELSEALAKLTRERPAVQAFSEMLEDKLLERSSEPLEKGIFARVLAMALISVKHQDERGERLDSPVLSHLGECFETSWKGWEPELREHLFYVKPRVTQSEKESPSSDHP